MDHLILRQDGYILVTVILILALLSLMGSHCLRMSIMEKRMSTSALLYQQTYYTAEAGVAHGKKVLEELLNRQDNGLDMIQTEPILIPESRLGDHSYQVRIIEPDHDIGYPEETGLIWLQSEATGPRGTRTSILVLLKKEKEYFLPDDDAGRNRSRDQDAITDFTRQM